MTSWRKHHEKMLQTDEEYRAEWERLGPYYDLVSNLIGLRIARGLTQEALAQKMGKQQPAVARLESARGFPSIRSLQEVAEALDADLFIRVVPREHRDSTQRLDRGPNNRVSKALGRRIADGRGSPAWNPTS